MKGPSAESIGIITQLKLNVTDGQEKIKTLRTNRSPKSKTKKKSRNKSWKMNL